MGSKIGWPNNELRDRTLAMIMPSNGNVYIALNMKIFKTYIFDWLGVVHDLFIIRVRFNNEEPTCLHRGPREDVKHATDENSGSGKSVSQFGNEPLQYLA